MDQELVLRAQRGDHEAFAALIVGRLGRLDALARLILRDDALAEDAVQDALVDAWRDLRGLRDPDRLDAWLRRLVVHSCYTLAKRRTTRRIREVRVEDGAGPVVPDVQGPVAMNDAVERALEQLPVDQRSLLVLVYYLDLPLTQAAEILGVPIGTAKSRHHRSLAAVRAHLDAASREPVALRGGTA